MLYDVTAVKANIRNREGKRVFYQGKGDQLTSSARDYLARERIEILPAGEAKPARYRLAGGGYTEEKPEHMTHLNAEVLVSKTHPRIAFRGAMDTLESEILLCQLVTQGELKGQLSEILELARKVVRWDVLGEVAEPVRLCGMEDAQIRQHSHFPQVHYGQPHFMPSAEDGEIVLRLNRARCAARQAELQAVAAFADREGNPTRTDLLQVLNRLSSMLYILMIREKAKSRS